MVVFDVVAVAVGGFADDNVVVAKGLPAAAASELVSA